MRRIKAILIIFYVFISTLFISARNPFSFDEKLPTYTPHGYPVLQGLSGYEGQRLALLQNNGDTVVVSKGEKVGRWYTEKIGENYVVLVEDKNRNNKITLEV